jgi:uncharacterized membrane protein YhaH (DUF805 family)
MNSYINVLKKYATFNGRARRSEYWMFYLFHLIAIFLIMFIDILTGSFDSDVGLGAFTGLYIILTLLPTLAVTVRRLHDINRSGWWILLTFIPLIGPITLFVFSVLDSHPNANDFGENPKAIT